VTKVRRMTKVRRVKNGVVNHWRCYQVVVGRL
jgi:hypothetical protein